MRITTQTLIKIAEDTVQQRVKGSHTLLAVYLCGSMNGEGVPALGDTGDVDLVFIHEVEPPAPREFVRITDDYHLDIAHHTRRDYRTPRELRTHPWLGPAIYNFRILHDPRHFLDFAQASVRDRFHQPAQALARARSFANEARQAWVSLLGSQPAPGTVSLYLGALASAINAYASLDGNPLPERRLLTQFFGCTAAWGEPGLYMGVVELLGGAHVDREDLRGWLPAWGEAYTAAAKSASVQLGLHPDRFRYYQGAFQSLLESERPADLLWPLFNSWSLAAREAAGNQRLISAWEQAVARAGLAGEGFGERVAALDGYLDLLEDRLERWGAAQGVGEFD